MVSFDPRLGALLFSPLCLLRQHAQTSTKRRSKPNFHCYVKQTTPLTWERKTARTLQGHCKDTARIGKDRQDTPQKSARHITRVSSQIIVVHNKPLKIWNDNEKFYRQGNSGQNLTRSRDGGDNRSVVEYRHNEQHHIFHSELEYSVLYPKG